MCVGAVKSSRPKLQARCRTGEIQRLFVYPKNLHRQLALGFRHVERAADTDFRQQRAGAGETKCEFLQIRGGQIAIERRRKSIEARQRAGRLANGESSAALDRCGFQIRCQVKIKIAHEFGRQRSGGGVGLRGLLHRQCRGEFEFAGLPVFQIAKREVQTRNLHHVFRVVGVILHEPDGGVVQRHFLDVNLRGLGRRGGTGRAGLRLFCGRFGERIEIAGAIGIFDHRHHGRFNDNFRHGDVAANNGPQTVIRMEFLDRQQGLAAGRLDFQVAQLHMAERTDLGAGHGHFGPEDFADFGQDDAFQKCRAGGDKISQDQQDDQDAGEPTQFAQPTAAFGGGLCRRIRFEFYFSHNILVRGFICRPRQAELPFSSSNGNSSVNPDTLKP